MRIFTAFLAACAIYLMSISGLLAQEDGKDFLTRTIQDALSGSGRIVSIDGFKGALSSEASFDRLTIADTDGVWLTLEEVSLIWSRSALLRGRLEVESLTGARLDLPRLPLPDKDALPEAEAAPFSLPELPVSINIGTFSIAEITLGAPVLGEEAKLAVKASAQLDDDLANIDLHAKRIDAKRGGFLVQAHFDRSDSMLELFLRLTEGDAGIAARLLNIPGQPSVDLSIEGRGPLDEFVADVKVATEDQERLAGKITLGATTPRRASATPDRRIQADIGGDITALLAPRYREFFGQDLRLTLDALLEGNGAVEISDFSLVAQAANLAGKVSLNANKWPTLIDISGQIANPEGTPVQLPLGGDATMVRKVDLRIDYDAADQDAILARFDITELALKDVAVAQSKLTLNGTLQGDVGRVGMFDGDVEFAAKGLAPRDKALAEAIGTAITGRTHITYSEDKPLEVSALDLSGLDYGLTGDAVISGLETGLKTNLNVALKARDLSRFSALAGRELDGQTELALKGEVALLGGQFDLVASGNTTGLALGIEQADAVLKGRTDLNFTVKRNEAGTLLRKLVLENAALSLTGAATLRTKDSSAGAKFLLKDISLVLPQYSGPVSVNATATQDLRGWSVDGATDGPYGATLTAQGLATGPNATLRFTADVPNVKPFADQIDGPVKATGILRNTPDGWQIKTEGTGPFQTQAAIEGLVAPKIDVHFDVSVPNLRPLVAQVNGPLQASGQLRQTDKGFFIDTKASGPYGAQALVEGLATGPEMALNFDVSVPNVAPLVPGISGPLAAKGVVRQTPKGIVVDTNATGPYGSRATVEGLATGPNMRLSFDVALPNVAPLVRGASGPFAAKGEVRQTPKGILVDTNATGPYASRAAVQGLVTGPSANLNFNVNMPDIGALVDKVNGPLSVTGSARKQGSAWQVVTDAIGPAGTQVQVVGLVNSNGRLNLDVTGNAPLGLSGPFLAPRDLQGQARFDLKVNGPAKLSSVSGSIQASGATFSAPNLRVALQGINAAIRLASNRAQIDLTGEATNGGRITAGGSIVLSGTLPADLAIAVKDVILIDPNLYRTWLNGAVTIAGPLTGGARISGQIDVGETEISVPSTGLTSIGDIPPIKHIGAKQAVLATRSRAGIDAVTKGKEPTNKGGTAFGLNIRVNGPNRIFVRGRGLDAELGGGLTLTGTTRSMISAGRFDLLRGRLDILGKRFDLVEGSIQFQGDLVPYIRFVSATSSSSGEVRVVVQGPADAPEVTFEATPEAPQDEVLAQLLFGRNISEISPIQALQLANAVATLAGRGGVGVITNLRNSFGLDDLDVSTTEDGATAVRAGKYISDNVYTDVTAASDGTGEVSLNLDITSHLKGKATLGSDGNSGIGIFFEKDY